MTTKRRTTKRTRSPAPAAPAALLGVGPVENGPRLATFSRGPSEEMRVNFSEFNGHYFVSLRIWYTTPDGRHLPDRARGMTVKARELAEFTQAMQVALGMLMAHE
jgi:hypothetical protein